MKTCEEKTQSVLERIDCEKKDALQRKKNITKIAAPIMSVCLVALLISGVSNSGLIKDAPIQPTDSGMTVAAGDTENKSDTGDTVVDTEETVVNTEKEAETTAADDKKTDEKANEKIVSTENNEIKGGYLSPATDDCARFIWRNKVIMYGDLYWAIDENPDAAFSVLAVYRPTVSENTDFTYDGKTIFQWADEAYGENASQDGMEGYKRAYHAYIESILPSIINDLTENGIECERAKYINDGITFVATADELENLPLDYTAGWYFSLAPENTK